TIEKCLALELGYNSKLKFWKESTAVKAYLVRLLEDEEIGIIAAADMQSFKNGREVQRDERKAIQPWETGQQQTCQEDNRPPAVFVEINKFSESPCLNLHKEYKQRKKHSKEFYILTGCEKPVHVRCLRDVPQWEIGVGYFDGE
ncbi:hypothetical protein HBI60_260540, partial [Parastagonospora nodorum]